MRITNGHAGNETDSTLDVLIIKLLRQKQEGHCTCGVDLRHGYQLTHKQYGEDITLNDLELKCGACHALEHGIKSHTGSLRMN